MFCQVDVRRVGIVFKQSAKILGTLIYYLNPIVSDVIMNEIFTVCRKITDGN